MKRENRDDLADKLTALTRDLILVRSTFEYPAERQRAFALIRNHLEPLDAVSVASHECGGFESLVALPAGGGAPDILLCGHLDVIEHPQLERYTSRVANGRITGPGAGDMKGGVAILLELFTRLQHIRPGLSLGLAIASDEELGGEHGFRHLFDDLNLRCGVAILPDGGSLNRITTEEKGILHLRLRRRGRAAHAARPWLGDNPVPRLLDEVCRIGAWFESRQDQTAPSAGGEHGFATCAPTVLRTDSQAVNRIPELAEVALDIRFPRPTSVRAMLDGIRDLIDPATELDVMIAAEPSHLDPDPHFLEITEAITGEPVETVLTSGGSDARFIAAYGIPVLVSRPLVGNLHAADEWIDVQSMTVYFEICEAYIRERLGV